MSDVRELHNCENPDYSTGYSDDDIKLFNELDMAQPYGHAIDTCVETSDNRLWVTNGEYLSQVNYCPYCGFAATVPANLVKTKT